MLKSYFSLKPRISVLSIGGMNIKDLPMGYSSTKPLVGPFHSIVLSLAGIITIPISKKFDINISGGEFSFYNIDMRLLDGNIDRMIAAADGWDAVSSKMDFKKGIGYGYIYGLSFTYYKKKNLSIEFGANIYNGLSKLNLRGEYYGGKINNIIEKKNFPDNNSKLNFSGIETVIEVSF
jgi:hypothetical protein